MSFLDKYRGQIIAVAGAGAVAAYLYNQYKAAPAAAPPAGPTINLELPLRETKNNPVLKIDDLKDKLSIEDVDFDGKRVLMRVDYNVPMKAGIIKDPTRIESTLETLEYILTKKGPQGGVKCIVLITHLGRPGFNPKKADFSLEPVAVALQKMLEERKIANPVKFLNSCVGPEVEKAVAECTAGTVFLCENLRFHPEEAGKAVLEDGSKKEAPAEDVTKFRQQLSNLGDIFVFEAFGAAHRPHSSVSHINVPQRVAGKLMRREMEYYAKVLGNPERPFLGIIGGSKVEDKIPVMEHMIGLVDELFIGGAMAYTFKKLVDGVAIGSSKFDEKGAKAVPAIMAKAKERGVKIWLPVDHVIADKFSADAQVGLADDSVGVPDGWMALDIGPKSRQILSEALGRAKTVLWNGPLGVFEMGPFQAGTLSAFNDLVAATQRGATTIIGGGDTGAASKRFFMSIKEESKEGGVKIVTKSIGDLVSHCSTGGGSSLVLMEGKQLPAVAALTPKVAPVAPTPQA